MSDRIDRLAGAGFRSPLGESAEGLQQTRGSWQGESVEVAPRDATSLLADAKEELAMAMSEQMEVKDIEERQVEDPGTYGERVNEIEGVWGMLQEQLPDLDLDALRGLLEHFLEQTDPSDEDIRRLVDQQFSDPSHAFAALDTIAGQLRTAGRDELATRVIAARDRLQAERGPDIRAGLNVTAAAFELADGDRQEAAALRDLYRASVFATSGPAGLYRGIIEQFGVEGFADRLRFLTRATADDLAAEGPSVEPARLQQLLGDLSTLRVLDTVHDRCKLAVTRLSQQGQDGLTPTGMLQVLLPLTTDPMVGPNKLLAVPDGLGVPADQFEIRVGVLRESRDILAMVPVTVYRDGDVRAAVLRAAQEAMDLTIEQEENAV